MEVWRIIAIVIGNDGKPWYHIINEYEGIDFVPETDLWKYNIEIGGIN